MGQRVAMPFARYDNFAAGLIARQIFNLTRERLPTIAETVARNCAEIQDRKRQPALPQVASTETLRKVALVEERDSSASVSKLDYCRIFIIQRPR